MGGHKRMIEQARAMNVCVRRFIANTRGNVAMIFALTLPVLVMITMGGVDINRASTARVNLQDALDAATLAAARSTAVTDVALKEVGLRALRANLAGYSGVTLDESKVTFTLNNDQVVIANAKVNVRAMVANIILPPYGKLLDDTLPVGAHSEVNRSSKNIEVALVLDITGSMDNCTRNCPAVSKIAALRTAAKQLVGIVVQPTQTPYYTRMAIIPYSIGVNMGGYANGARGTPTQSTNISAASWSTGSAKTITGISRANPAVVSATAHGFVTGDHVWIADIAASGNGTRMSNLNSTAYKVTRKDANSFSIQTAAGSNINTSNYATWSSGGKVTKCQVSDCSIVVTANNHGLPTTQTTDTGTSRPPTVYITDVRGMTQINDRAFEIGNVTPNTFSIGVNGYTYGAYNSGGKSWCGQNGCQWRAFRRMSDNALTAIEISDCVSERTGSNAYNSTAPSTSPVGSNYAPAGNSCPTPVIQPLTSTKKTLTDLIDSLEAVGSTSGQIGLAWGWYTVSPTFNSLWNGAATAGPNVPRDTLKVVVMMTDGEFNGPYCTGVIAQDALTGSGQAYDKIACNATNGSSVSQAAALCTAIKAQNIVIYTVGFQIDANGDAARMLRACATQPSADHAFLPNSGDDLSDDFAEIGRAITRLRISK